MHTLTNPKPSGAFVEVDTLTCPGCHDTAIPEPPSVPALGALAGGEFSHRDGSDLCPDRRGRVGDPIEARR